MTPRVLVVGGGLTSAVTSLLLREELPARCQLTVWDKARGAGGRMATARGPPGCGSADLGLQYVTVTPHYQQLHRRHYADLTSTGVLVPLTAHVPGMRPSPPDTKQFVAADGSSALVKHFLSRAETTPEFGHQVTELSLDGSTCSVLTAAGRQATFDAVVLTMPVPQILALGGSIGAAIEQNADVVAGLRAVQYSSRYALGLFFDRPGAVDVPWGAQYVSGHPVIRYVAVDNVKRGRQAAPTSVVVHTSVEFGAEHVELTPEQVEPILVGHVRELFPEWPQPAAVRCQKWRYSQVTAGYPGRPRHLVLSQRPLVVAAGDAFTQSNVDGCLESAASAAHTVAQLVKAAQS